MKKGDYRHVIIAVTDACPVHKLWEAAIRATDVDHATLVALFLPNRRWQRAASLPFTREFPSVGGDAVNFSAERAVEIDRETQEKVKQTIEELASATDSVLEFRVLHEEQIGSVEELPGDGDRIVIASSCLAKRGVLSQFENLHWQIVLVDAPEDPLETR